MRVFFWLAPSRARACEVADWPLQEGHLSESQRAMVAAKLANLPAHRPPDKSANLQTSQARAAEMLNVSERTVASAVRVMDLLRDATAIKIRAVRKCGQLLREMQQAKGGEQYHAVPTGDAVLPVPTLAELGIAKIQSSRWCWLHGTKPGTGGYTVATRIKSATK